MRTREEIEDDIDAAELELEDAEWAVNHCNLLLDRLYREQDEMDEAEADQE